MTEHPARSKDNIRLRTTLLLLTLVMAACAPAGNQNTDANNGAAAAGVGATQAPATPPMPAADEDGSGEATAQPTVPAAATASLAENGKRLFTEDTRPDGLRRLTAGWKTNWALHTITYDELLAGGPPRDGIPSIDDPQFITAEEASGWLAENEPVVALALHGDARAYPLQILTWHEIVNDTVGGEPIIVTFCPLCNSAIVFERKVDGEILEFGTSGLLRNSDLVMYDRTSESLWQQLTGDAIVGDMVGKQLTFVASAIISFADFHEAYPDGVILSRETGYTRRYGENPYTGYDSVGENPFLFRGPIDERLPAMARVVTVSLGGQDVAYPYVLLEEVGVVNDRVGEQALAVFFAPGTSSALGASVIAEGRDVGATGVFDSTLGGQVLTFQRDGEVIVDEETGSTWNISGQATDGPLAGSALEPIVHGDHFWFAWAAFKPETSIYGGSS